MRTLRRLLLLCGVAVAVPAGAEPLGRLFFTPEQRLLLERQRQENLGAEGESRIRLDGLAARRGRSATIWLNGRAERDGRLGKAAALRVGESLDPVTGIRQDVVPDGSIRPTRR